MTDTVSTASAHDNPSAAAPIPAPPPAFPIHRPGQISPHARLGEELPVFCEKCGYQLHGLPQMTCPHCSILQFHCPECGHHQPINTLRPAAQRILGRLRAFALALSIFFRINYFLWLLLAWYGMGYEWSYAYDWNVRSNAGPNHIPLELDGEHLMVFALFAAPFGMVSRMLLLRWRRGYLIGACLGVLVVAAACLGAWFRYSFMTQWTPPAPVAPPFTTSFMGLMFYTLLIVMLGSTTVWGTWYALVNLFLPKRTAAALLEWQRSLSGTQALSRE